MILHGTFNFRQSLYSYSTESVVLRKKTINKKKIHKEPKDKQYEICSLLYISLVIFFYILPAHKIKSRKNWFHSLGSRLPKSCVQLL